MATKSLLEAFGYEKPRSRKLNARQLRRLILNEARRPLSEKASADKVEDDKFPMPLSSVNPELATKLVTTGAHDGEKDDDVIFKWYTTKKENINIPKNKVSDTLKKFKLK